MILDTLINFLLQAVVVFMFVFVVSFIFWMAIDAAKQDKFWWLMVIVGVPFVGSVVYYFVEHEHDYAKLPKSHIVFGRED